MSPRTKKHVLDTHQYANMKRVYDVPSDWGNWGFLCDLQNSRDHLLFFQKWKPSFRSSYVSLNDRWAEAATLSCRTDHCPKDAFQLQDQLWVFALVTVLSYEVRKVGEVPLVLEDLAAEFCLRHFTIKMRRHRAVKSSVHVWAKIMVKWTGKTCRVSSFSSPEFVALNTLARNTSTCTT